MSQQQSPQPNLIVPPYFTERAKTDPAYAQFLKDIQALVNHLPGFSAYLVGGEPENTNQNQ